jgi:hypothetical protein
MLPDSIVEEVKREVDIFFLDDGSDDVTRGGGRPPDATTKFFWENVCAYLDLGLDEARANIIPTVIIDFPFCDTGPGRLNLRKDDGLFERGWVFRVVESNTRLMIHGHTFLKWSERARKPVKNRADELTSVNYRMAVLDNASGSWKQNDGGTPYLPVNCDVQWQSQYRGNHANAVWRWREWRGDEAGIPRADLAQGTRLDAGNRQKYNRVKTLLQLVAEADYEETYSMHATNNSIRSHGQLEDVDEMDITPIRKKVCPSERARFEIGVRDAGWVGLRLAALCIGVGAYSGSSRLDNPVRDAEVLFEAINKCPDCRAAIVRDPPDKSTVVDHLQNKFLNELAALSADKLPEVVMLVLASHGMQHESNVFLIPAKAKCDSKMLLEDNCLSHTRVLEYLHECLDARARRASGAAFKEVKFVLIMDMCRVPGEFALTKTISEPDQNKAPECWSICYSTSRGSVAADGAPGSHSPLVLGLLDPQSGIFAPGVSLKEGIEHACSVVEQQSGVDTRQSPTDMKLRRLGNFVLQPTGNDMGPLERSKHCSQLMEYLKGHFAEEIAAKICSKLGIVKKEDLVEFSDSEINGLCLMDAHRKILLKLVNEAKIHQMAVAGALSLKEIDFNAASIADTISERGDVVSDSEDDDDLGCESVAIKHPGNPEDFQKDMQGFIDTFISIKWIIDAAIEPGHETFKVLGPDCPQGEWTYCMFVWIRFAKEAYFDETSLKLWRECIKTPAQQTLLASLDGCLKKESTRHKLWPRSDLKSNCSKEFAAAIYVTDLMVRHHLRGHAASLGLWERDVVEGWFEPQNFQDALVFLLRANKFLREHLVGGIQVVENVVKTQSYVAFLRMHKLASLLLFEFLEVGKLQDNSSSGPARSQSLLFQGFRMFISSSGLMFSLTDQDAPARRVMPFVRQGLQRLAQLPAEAWGMMGPVSTAKDFLSGVATKSVTAQGFLLQDDRTIELDALVALSLLKKDDASLEDGSDDNGIA